VGRVVRFRHYVDCGPTVTERATRDGAPLRLLSVCRLVPKKGIDVILRALALLGPEVPCRYRIVGGGPERAQLYGLARELGLPGVEFVGPLPPDIIPTELAQADVFVLGLRTARDGDRDGVPNAVLEAMAAGVPVVVSDAGAVSEVVRHGSTGWLLPPDQPRAFAEALREVASDHAMRRRVAEGAHLEIRRRFSSELRPSPLAVRLAREIASTRIRSSGGPACH